MSQQEWNIRACADQCAACGRKYNDKEKMASRLVFTEEGYQREDFCDACWDAREDKSGLSVWTSVWHAPAPPKEEALKKETAESLLRELMEMEDPSKMNVIFILAVMLERRRIFVEKEVQLQPDGLKIRVYEHKKTGESFIVPDPDLRLKEIEHVQQEVMEMLGIIAPKPKAEAPAAEPAATKENEPV